MNTYYEVTPTNNITGYLRQPLNDGSKYADLRGCFCQKGAYFAASMGLGTEDLALTLDLSLEENQDRLEEFSLAVRDFCGMLSYANPKLLLALDIAEYIHISGYPQKAKLYLMHVIRKFDLDLIPLSKVRNGDRSKAACWCEDRRGWMSPRSCNTLMGERRVTTNVIHACS